VERLLSILAIVVALVIGAIAVLEIDNRNDEGQLAVPTIAPPTSTIIGPTMPPSTTATAKPTGTTKPTPRRTAAAAETAGAETPAPSAERTPAPTRTPTRTATPPRTPTPAPAITPGRLDTSQGATPRTGGGAVGSGVFIAAFALVARAGLSLRRRSY
jgi:hypothetical protein